MAGGRLRAKGDVDKGTIRQGRKAKDGVTLIKGISVRV